MDLGKIRTPKVCLLLVIGVTAGQFAYIIPYMFIEDQYVDYNDTILPFAKQCDVNSLPERNNHITRNPIEWWLRCFSYTVTGFPNALLMPFTAAVLPLAYLTGLYITGNRFVGLTAMFGTVFNPYYYSWATTGTYDQVWTCFLLLSIILLFKKPTLGFGSLVVSFLAKSNAALYFPMWFYTMLKTKESKFTIILSLGVTIIALLLVIRYNLFTLVTGSHFGLHIEEAIPVTIGLFWPVLAFILAMVVWNNGFKSSKRPKNEGLVLIWILGIMISAPLIHAFTGQTAYGYRYVPLAVFMGIYLGQTILGTLAFRKEKLGMISL